MKAISLTLIASASAKTLRAQTPVGDASFESWAAAHGKKYATAEERAFRAGVFAATAASIAAHQARVARGEETHTLALNAFSDLTHAEFLAQRVGGRKASSARKAVAGDAAAFAAAVGSAAPPASIDWVAKGAVTPVKDQGQCGSCWAFATTVATEGAVFVGSAKLLSLSEQQIVSCDTANGNAGCNGGIQQTALEWLAKEPGQCSEASYPYTSGNGADGKCLKTCAPVAKITGSIEVQPHNQTALELAIASAPLSLSVDASGAFWQSYSGGVVTRACKCNSDACLDHGVGGVGFGTDATTGEDYYQVKNSWGADWGMKGYILLGRGTKYGKGGQCGVEIDSTLAIGHAL